MTFYIIVREEGSYYQILSDVLEQEFKNQLKN